MPDATTKDYESIAKALFESYETIYDIDAQTNAYSTFHESAEYKRLEVKKIGDDFFQELKKKVPTIIAEEDQHYVLRMLDKSKIIAGLNKEEPYSFIYRIKRDNEEVYHQIRAVSRLVDGNPHIYVGVKNIDYIIQKERAHRNKIAAFRQKENNHMQAVLASAAAYMEANVTKDILLEKSDDKLEKERRFIKRLPPKEEVFSYSAMHKWICNNLVVKNKEKYKRVAGKDYLLNLFKRGERRSSVLFSVYTEEGGIQPCREVFFLYEDETTRDVHVFCVIYDLTEQQKNEQEREDLEKELQMSRVRNFTSQMQPHFLYNTLGSIQEVILMDPQYAAELLGYFTVHLRTCIRAMTKDQPLPFSNELENINAYSNIEKMRFGDKLRIHYETLVTDFPVLPLSIQPLVENAIRHGVHKKGAEGGDVYVRTWEESSSWVVQVEDNGVGFDVEKYMEKQRIGEGDSTGIKNIQFRLEKVMNATLDIRSRKGEGTAVVVRIPKQES